MSSVAGLPPRRPRGLCRIVGRIRPFREAGSVCARRAALSPARHGLWRYHGHHGRSSLPHGKGEGAQGSRGDGVHLGSPQQGGGWVKDASTPEQRRPQLHSPCIHRGSSSDTPHISQIP